MKFLEHDGFINELHKVQKKQPKIVNGMAALAKLLERQFDPHNPVPSIGPGKIHRIVDTQVWSLWKVEVAVPGSGLRPNQWPRLWMAVSGDTIVYLKVASHTENYDNTECEATAKSRATDFF